MSEKDLQRIKEEIKAFDASHNTPEECRKALQQAGILDARGNLAKPYRTHPRLPSRRTK